ncbi:MAG: hypothetical protein HYX71_06785 [Opitutae bacterium]|nr:hypothetical protein [Opitutae bacterium]
MNSANNISQKLAALVFFLGGSAVVLLFASLIQMGIENSAQLAIGSFINAVLHGVVGLIGSIYMFNRGWRIWKGKEGIGKMPPEPPKE